MTFPKANSEGVGRHTKLDNELMNQIRDLVLEGKEMTEIAEIINIPYATMAGWKKRNYDQFEERYENFRHERMVIKAKGKVDEKMDSDNEKISLDAATFILETLGKKDFSKRSELTGSNGKDLIPKPILGDVPINNSNSEDNVVEQADPNSTRGNFSQQDSVDSTLPDTSSTIGQEANDDINNLGIISALETRSDEGLPSDNAGPQLL